MLFIFKKKKDPSQTTGGETKSVWGKKKGIRHYWRKYLNLKYSNKNYSHEAQTEKTKLKKNILMINDIWDNFRQAHGHII